MGVLWRKRSLLLKLLVVIGTAWFTVAFLIFTDGRTQNRMNLAVDDEDLRHKPANNIEPERLQPERVVPFKDSSTNKNNAQLKKQVDNNVLLPPQSMAGELGKPVILPTNLSGKSKYYLLNILTHFNLVFLDYVDLRIKNTQNCL